MKKVIISGGGTGGHIFPALSIANALKRLDKDIEILFVGAEGKMEMEKVPEAGYKIVGLPVRGLQRKLTLSNLKVLWNLWRSLKKAKRGVCQRTDRKSGRECRYSVGVARAEFLCRSDE